MAKREVKTIVRRMPKQLSEEQNSLHEFFSGESFWGMEEDNLPKMNGALTSGGGIMKNGDGGATGSMFGVRR